MLSVVGCHRGEEEWIRGRSMLKMEDVAYASVQIFGEVLDINSLTSSDQHSKLDYPVIWTKTFEKTRQVILKYPI